MSSTERVIEVGPIRFSFPEDRVFLSVTESQQIGMTVYNAMFIESPIISSMQVQCYTGRLHSGWKINRNANIKDMGMVESPSEAVVTQVMDLIFIGLNGFFFQGRSKRRNTVGAYIDLTDMGVVITISLSRGSIQDRSLLKELQEVVHIS